MTDHQHTFNPRVYRDGGDAVCTECGEWVHIHPDTHEFEALEPDRLIERSADPFGGQ